MPIWGVLCNELASWPGAGKLSLDHFTYGQIGAGWADAKARLREF